MKAKNAVIPLILAVILSTLGLAFAAWTDQVIVTGTAKMGTVTLAFDLDEPPVVTEYHKEGGEGPLIPGEYLGKEVASSSARYEEPVTDIHTGKEGYKKLIIEVEDAYPCLHVFTVYKLHNIGTIPVMVYEYIVYAEKYRSDTGAFVCNLVMIPQPSDEFLLFEDYNGNGIQDDPVDEPVVMWMRLTNSLPVQIDPCYTDKREFDLHFLQPAQQCHIYKVFIEINAIQWNKLYEVQVP